MASLPVALEQELRHKKIESGARAIAHVLEPRSSAYSFPVIIGKEYGSSGELVDAYSRTATSTKRKVKIFVVAAAGLPRSVFRAPKPLAIVTVDGEQVLMTDHIKNSCNPYWGETCVLDVMPDSVVTIEVQDKHKLNPKHPERASMGTVSVRISDYLDLSLETEQHEAVERHLCPLHEEHLVRPKLIFHLRAFAVEASPTPQHRPLPLGAPLLSMKRLPDGSESAVHADQLWIPAGVRLSVSLFGPAGRGAEVEVLSGKVDDYGASAVILRGQVVHAPQPLYVALKVFRDVLDPTLLRRELDACTQVQHRYILSYMGTASWGCDTILVAPYMKNGNLTKYLEAHPRADRATLMLQVADAVRFLHDGAQPRHVHGNLKCENVLVSDSGNALLEHFSLTMQEQSEDTPTTVTEIRQYHTLRFAAPELLVDTIEYETFLPPTAGPTRRPRSTATDVYAFGMTMLQAYSGEVPWRGESNMKVYVEVAKGQPPPRPSAQHAASLGFTDKHWNLCLRCWSRNPELRPSMRRVLRTLEELKPQ